MTWFAGAEKVPWKYDNPGGPTYYRDLNKPIAVVLHIMQGYYSTSKNWALSGYLGASWHGSTARDGRRMQHLESKDGGYHAGIKNDAPNPTWKLWRGHGQNINHYTIGHEFEGFTGQPWPRAQLESAAEFVAFFCEESAIPVDRDHIIGHYEIDLRNRPEDPGSNFPWQEFLVMVEEHMGMTQAERQRLEALEAIVSRIDNKSVVLGPDGNGYDLLGSLKNQNLAIKELQGGQLPGVDTVVRQALKDLGASLP